MEQHQCIYCKLPIKTCLLKCAKCPDFTLCLQCFSCGVEAGSHKPDHGYQILDENSITLFNSRIPWSAFEEEALLDAVEQFSIGNWEDVSDHLKTKTAEECRDHFNTYFINGNIGKATFPSESSKKVSDHTASDKELSTPVVVSELSIQEQQELGYMPLRDDFENEYDDDAESLVSCLSWDYEDEDIDIAFKLLQVDLYRQRIKERERRKKFAKDFSIIQNATTNGSKKSQADKKKQSKDEKDLRERMRIFGRFNRPSEYEHIFHNLQREKRMKSRIKELVKYRRNGLTRLSDSTPFENARLRRDKQKEVVKKMASVISGKPASLSHSKKERDGNSITKDDNMTAYDHHRLTSGVFHSLSGFNLLSPREKKLCISIGLSPTTYITIKTCIIKDYLQRRQGVPLKIRFPNNLDKSHRRKIVNFLSDSGWISATGSG